MIALIALGIWFPFRRLRFDSATWKANPDVTSSRSVRSRMQPDLMEILNTSKPDRKTVQTMLGPANEAFKPGDERVDGFFQKATDYYWVSNPLGRPDIKAENCELLVIEYDAKGRLTSAYRDVYST